MGGASLGTGLARVVRAQHRVRYQPHQHGRQHRHPPRQPLPPLPRRHRPRRPAPVRPRRRPGRRGPHRRDRAARRRRRRPGCPRRHGLRRPAAHRRRHTGARPSTPRTRRTSPKPAPAGSSSTGVGLVGIDAVNIDRTDAEAAGARPAHSLLLAAGIPVVEHLTDLEQLPPYGARFTAVPPRVSGFGTFPVRVYAAVPVSRS